MKTFFINFFLIIYTMQIIFISSTLDLCWINDFFFFEKQKILNHVEDHLRVIWWFACGAACAHIISRLPVSGNGQILRWHAVAPAFIHHVVLLEGHSHVTGVRNVQCVCGWAPKRQVQQSESTHCVAVSMMSSNPLTSADRRLCLWN